MKPRSHGGTDQGGVPLHDFSSNSNTCGPCPLALAAVQRADPTCYPDATYTALRGQLADFHDVDVQRVVLAGSASEFIFRITALAVLRGARAVWLPPHGYGDYAHAAQAWKLPLATGAGQAQLRWACDPSSPLGVAHAGLDQLLGGGALCVLDRAYEPLRLTGALAVGQEVLQKFWQLWTPNKALGLTGVRAAYVIAPPGSEELVVQLEGLAPSWPVGAHGVAMLHAWTTPDVQGWLFASLATLRDWKTRQVTLCESLGWNVLLSNTNFFCAQPALPEGISLPQALAQLRSQGIKLRDATSFGLPGHVRMSAMSPAAQDALHNAWQHLIGKAI
ncbi:MAG: aminotransferase class I/II-fold pyridoxal phosphate-dependent enzyme [Polaromonas sp.]|uniref:aminotransferase class I/II-fold pyridoxal phosphate-dependent enzyme n=1 Tax=Polaromonas sp. TaxID=1869339 RepID=UPI002730C645|nr:aminotransferase class I/II-fold pyridoxal phosphate-dependent enzyme [Polaromonas sp.]MDP1740825.1 aminotransferase class I/II-fold pyridoxal phosphate-dependent enzyme [Polaromonas sp.]MDP3354596.1 aminotransferase class I/II-fold pyridoxal phosphate-dependent enzyme [Polaromonas sp.]